MDAHGKGGRSWLPAGVFHGLARAGSAGSVGRGRVLALGRAALHGSFRVGGAAVFFARGIRFLRRAWARLIRAMPLVCFASTAYVSWEGGVSLFPQAWLDSSFL